jgi:SAM-dependent methyltransferase
MIGLATTGTSTADRSEEAPVDDYRAVNKASWDERAPAHAASPDYAVDRFVDDPEFISHVVSFDRPLLGDVAGARAVHLQCHIGTDTVSLARLGATMTGLDFSSESLAQARALAAATSTEIRFVESDVYDARASLGEGDFDLVYTGVGALGWLPSVDRWAAVVASLLRPGGRLFIREGHPVLWAIDDARADTLVLEYPYFELEDPMIWDEGGTYVQTDVTFEHNLTHEWNHGLGEIVTALLDAGMEITGLAEHQSVPWDALPGQMVDVGRGEHQLADRPWRLPHTYTLQAVKKG